MKKTLPLVGFLILFLSIPYFGNSVVVPSKAEQPGASVNNLTATDLLTLDKKELESKIGRKLKFKEKLAIRIIKRKLKKQASKNANQQKTEPKAVLGFVFSTLGFIASLIALVSSGYGVLFAVAFGILGLIFSAIGLRKTTKGESPKKGKGLALAGMIIGIVVSGTWLLLVLAAFIVCAYGNCF